MSAVVLDGDAAADMDAATCAANGFFKLWLAILGRGRSRAMPQPAQRPEDYSNQHNGN